MVHLDENRNGRNGERGSNIPAGVFEDLESINLSLEEINKLKNQKRYEEAAELAENLLYKKILPISMKKPVIMETVDILLELGRFADAQELLRLLKDLEYEPMEVKKIEQRMVYIGIVKELLRKNKKVEMPWSTIPRLITLQADEEIEKLFPGYKRSVEDQTLMEREVIATGGESKREDSEIKKYLLEEQIAKDLVRNPELIAADKEKVKKDRFWIVVVMVILLAIGTGFMLAVSYLAWTSDTKDIALINPNKAQHSNPNNDADDSNQGKIEDADNDISDSIEYETITVETIYSPGEWFFIQAGAYSNAEVAKNTHNRLLNAGLYGKLIHRDPILLMVFAGTSQGQSEKIVQRLKNHEQVGNISMYARGINARAESMVLEGADIDREILSLLGERMAGYLRIVSDTSQYLIEEMESDKRKEAALELISRATQIQEQIEIILSREENQDNRTLLLWYDELAEFTLLNQSAVGTADAGLGWRIQEHLFRLLVPQIWSE